MTRHEAREQAFIILFEKCFSPDSDIQELIEIAKEYNSFEADEFFLKLVHSAADNSEEIDKIIEENTKGWTIKRIPKVSLAVLRLALAEILYIDDVPDGVTINEAVEISKLYSTQKDSSFVNALLGTYVRSSK